MSTDAFTRGVNWGKFVATVFDGDDLKTEGARSAALHAAIRYADDHADTELIDVVSDARFAYRCHGTLADGAYCADCADCGTISPGAES